MPKKAGFRIGDKVKVRKEKDFVYTIVELRFREVVRTESHYFPATWVYKINDGHCWFYTEKLLLSVVECINCGNEGWNWICGCPVCGLSPEDAINDHATDIYDGRLS